MLYKLSYRAANDEKIEADEAEYFDGFDYLNKFLLNYAYGKSGKLRYSRGAFMHDEIFGWGAIGCNVDDLIAFKYRKLLTILVLASGA